MQLFIKTLLVTFILVQGVYSQDPSPAKLHALYNSLDPRSISQHLAFYELYPHSPEGQQALRNAMFLLSGGSQNHMPIGPLSPSLATSVNAIVNLVNKPPGDSTIELSDEELAQIDILAKRLPNRQFTGYYAYSEAEVMALPSNQIDLARGILLSQLGNGPQVLRKIRSYEAALDLMALQILTRVNFNSSPKEKIRAINHFIFEEMGFRFPPHSAYAQDIDLYTFLPSVLDSRKGVCLGVSLLYICLAQRLNLNLEIVTPPGHIFVRWSNGRDTINIETTARGIDLPAESYLGIDTRALQLRTLKETIGMAHFNQASIYWELQDYGKALASYQKAYPYMPEDKQLMTLMGFAYLLSGEQERAKTLLQQVIDYLPDYAVSKDTMAEDYLTGLVGIDGIKAFFIRVNETRDSLIEKRKALEAALRNYPRFREGIFSLAGTWLQLHREGEALEMLERYHKIDPCCAPVEYYLAVLYAERMDYNSAWKHLRLAEALANERDHAPKALLELRRELAACCPE